MNTHEQKDGATYDFVIVGAGASGPIVANSLAADGYTVLLLEAGLGVDAEDKDVWDPQRWFKVQGDPVIEWGYHSTPQKNLNSRVLSMQQSRCLGGCTVHNAMVYVRGGQSTYNYWENSLGCKGWGYDSLLPLFEEIEDKIGILQGEPDVFVDDVFTATKANGFPYNKDYNTQKTEYGSVPFQFTIEKDGDGLRRTTSYDKYIRAQSPQKELTIEPGAFVHHILFDNIDTPDLKAIGVRYQNSIGDLKYVYVRHEVILSAGTIASPKILLQSGVGPAADLEALGITVIKNLSQVGKNFYDDLGMPAVFIQSQKKLPAQPYGFVTSGVFASDVKNFNPENPQYADINLQMQICSSDLPGAPSLQGLPISYISAGMAAMHLKSRGSISLASADPREAPLVDPNYLSHADDLEHCLNAIKLLLKIAWNPALDKWRSIPLLPTAFPCADAPDGWLWLGKELAFDEYLTDYIVNYAVSIQHYIGSCTMGTNATNSVVGPDLKVHGIAGLRVIDASVAPTPVSGNTAGVSYIIGAKGAQLLKRSK